MSSISTQYQNQVADLLSQIRSHQQRADMIRSEQAGDISSLVRELPRSGSVDQGRFGNFVTDALNEVNATAQESKVLKEAYERGEDVPLTDVVLSMQKASIGFEATLQVRNKLLRAYEDIMNMPV